MHQILQILAFISTFKSRDSPLLECRWSFSKTSCLSHLKTSDACALERKEDPPDLARICITSIRFFIVLFVVSWLKVVISQSLTELVVNQFTAVSSRMKYKKQDVGSSEIIFKVSSNGIFPILQCPKLAF